VPEEILGDYSEELSERAETRQLQDQSSLYQDVSVNALERRPLGRRKSDFSVNSHADRPAAALPKTPNYQTSKFKFGNERSGSKRMSFVAPSQGKVDESGPMSKTPRGGAVPRLRGIQKQATIDF